MAAHYLLGTLNEHGYQCPKDVSIMSFDNAGFTSGTPWLGVNPNHAAINAASQVDDPCSVFSHYRKLIRLRKEYDNITHGDYTLLLPDHPSIFAYERHWEDQVLTVICSFSNAVLEDAAITSLCRGRLLLGNYPAADALHRLRHGKHGCIFLNANQLKNLLDTVFQQNQASFYFAATFSDTHYYETASL